ncbi:MAG: hypothetical protein AMJ78_09730 [Omnitrophica WOR_2 bacterium SM23_29]|nr:MAG: hypothetical protein AMJ78_09730 [Omnitrophica WOR_2 bacterium SM23_29]
MKNKNLFILIGIFWVAIIVVFIASKEFTLQMGEQVLLKTVPVDPRDLFRGDYVILSYEISTLNLGKIPADYKNFMVGDQIFLALKKEYGYGLPSRIYRKIPKNEKLFLKGAVKSLRGNRLSVEYGIESYFVPEGKGRELERARGKTLVAKISVDRFGNALIKALLLEGREVKF